MQDYYEYKGLRIDEITVGMVQTNCWILSNIETKKAAVIDPGDESERILALLNKLDVELEAILLTHGHFDHISGVEGLLRYKKVPVYAYEQEKQMIEDDNLNLSRSMGESVTLSDIVYRKENDVFEVIGFPVKLLATPGHTKGSCCYYIEKAECLFSGDTLFLDSVGRTDFPTGNTSAIIKSVKELAELPEKTYVYPGHGSTTTIKYEKANNPYINDLA